MKKNDVNPSSMSVPQLLEALKAAKRDAALYRSHLERQKALLDAAIAGTKPTKPTKKPAKPAKEAVENAADRAEKQPARR